MEREQLNLPLESSEEKRNVAGEVLTDRPESQLLLQVRQNFGIFGGISLIFGLCLTLLFYKAGFGINNLIFTLVMIVLLRIAISKLGLKMKASTYFYYVGASLLALSSTLTSSEILHFINTIGILLLLDLSLLQQLYEDKQGDFTKHFLRMLGLPFVCLTTIWMPFADSINYLGRTKVLKNDKVRNVFIGILLSIPFLWIVTALLASADQLFGKVANNIFDIVLSADIFSVLLITLFGFLTCYCIICGSVSKVGLEEKKDRKKADASIGITFLFILCMVYIIFCFIQLTYLFADGLFTLPQEFTYAEYARRGFFELLAVAILNVSIILICRSVFQESKVLRLIITVMTFCTYIMIASATYRMLLYIGAYHLTFLRLFVLLSLLIISLVLGGVITAEYVKSFPLFRYCVMVTTICYILFSLSKPDYYIADYLLDHKDQLNQEDLAFLTYELSLDAAPVVVPLVAEGDRFQISNNVGEDAANEIPSEDDYAYLTRNYYQRIHELSSEDDLRSFNYSMHLARNYAEKYKK